MDWQRDLPTWPLNTLSRRVVCAPHKWHVQMKGTGPDILLLHGAGGSTHGWRRVIPELAEDARVIAIDLPGQGFTRLGNRTRCSLTAMRDDIAALCKQQSWSPEMIVGHSAGGALALSLAQKIGTRKVVCLNAALGRFEGMAEWLFPALARVVAVTPFFPSIFAAVSGRRAQVSRLLESTGSAFDEETLELYMRLAGDRGHVDGTLQMMAQWDITPVEALLPDLDADVLFLAGQRDGTVPPAISQIAADKVPGARFKLYPECGHLIAEEAPAPVIADVLSSLRASDTRPAVADQNAP